MATLQLLAEYDEAPGIVASPARIDAWMEVATAGDVFLYATRSCLPVNSAGAKHMRALADRGLVVLTQPRSSLDRTVFNYRAHRTDKPTALTRPARPVLVAPSAKLVDDEAAIVDALLPVLERFAQHGRPCPTDKQLASKAMLTEAAVKDGLEAMVAAHLIKVLGCAAPIRVVGLDLTDTVLAMDIRLGGDVSGPARVSLAKVVNGENGATFETQGIHVRGVSIVDGVENSDVRIRMDRETLQNLDYMGSRGDVAEFEYAFVIGGRTRLRGRVILPAHAYRSDAAPVNREPGYSFASSALTGMGAPNPGATLVISQDGGATVLIDGADMVSASIVRAESARDEAVAAADDTVAALDSLGQDAFSYVGRPANAVLVTGTPKGVGSVFWHDAVDVAGNLTAVDVFDRAAGVVNVAVYRGQLNALERVALGSFATTGTGTSHRIALGAPLPVRVGDILAIQPADGALTVAEVQSGDIGYTYSSPFLPENASLDAPTTNGQVQVRFVITYREQIVTADNFLALSEIRLVGARARALSSAANPAGYVAWSTTGAPTGHTVTWGSYTAKLGPLADRMEFPQWSVSKPLFVASNSLGDTTDVIDRWSQVLAARYGQHLVSVARYSSDRRMVYRTGAAPLNLTLAGTLPAGGSVAVTRINGALIDGNNPAAFLTTGDATVVTGMSMVGYASRNGVERKVTVSAPNGASFEYSVTQAPGQTAITFDGPVLFTPEASLSIRGSTCVVWMGNNFFYSEVPNQYDDYTNPQMWVDLKLIVSFLQSQGCQVLLLPVIPASLPEWVEGLGTPLTASRAANARTEALFPGLMGRHADGRDLIKFLQDRKDGSPEAQADVDKGWIPRNLHRAGDPLHLNEAEGDLAVADFVDSALRSQVGPPAITQATTFTIAAQGPQAGADATASVRVERDQLASLADAVDGVVQDAVYRPTIAAAIADFDVGTFFVSRDLDGLTAHTGEKWQYKVTAAPPYYSDEGAWSDTNAAALGLDAYVGTTPARLPVSEPTTEAISSSTGALASLTNFALARRIRTDTAMVLSAEEKATGRQNLDAAARSEILTGRGEIAAMAFDQVVEPIELNAEQFRQGGMTDQQVLEAAFAAAALMSRFVAISSHYTMTASIEVLALRLMGRGGSISGYNGLGFLIAGTIIIAGDLTISGFGDGTENTGAENNKTNYEATFGRLKTGSHIPLINIQPGVKVERSRAFLTAGSLTSDVLADKTIVVDRFNCSGLATDGVMQVIMMRCPVRRATGGGNVLHNMIGAARVVGGFLFYLDGLGAGDPAYALQGTQYFEGDEFRSIINRTTTGNSTTGNNYESHAYMLYGHGATIVGPDIEDCTGTQNDCEGIYTKSYNVTILGGRLKNAGTVEGAIAIKGASQNADLSGNGKGGKTKILGAIIEFDKYSHNNAGTIIQLTPRALTIAAPYQADVDITAIGCRSRTDGNPDGDIRIDGYLNSDGTNPDPNQGIRINLRSVRSQSTCGVFARGAFYDADIRVHATDVDASGSDWATIRLISVANRGIAHRNLRLWTHTQMNNFNLLGKIVSAIHIDNQDYDFDGVISNDSVWDVVAASAILRPIRLDAADTAAGRFIRNVEFRNWNFKTPLQADQGPIWSDGFALVHSGRIDLTFSIVTTDNATYTAAAMRVPDGQRVKASLEAFAVRSGAPTDAIHQPQVTQLFYNNAGVMTAIGAQTAAAAIGSAKTASVSAALNASAATVRWRVNGDDPETWNWSIRMQVEVR